MKKTLTEIQKLHQSGKLEEAKQGYLNFLAANPKETIALHLLGLLYAEEGDLIAAQNYLEKAREFSPNDPAILLHLGNIFKNHKLFRQAEKVLLDLTLHHPRFAAGFNNLGTVYFLQNNYQQAAQQFQTAIDLQSDYADAYYNLGLALVKMAEKEKAINTFQSLLELNPKHAAGQFQLANLFMQLNQNQKAIEHFLLIEKSHPFHFETQTNLATSYLKLGKLNEAKAHYQKALEIIADDVQVLFNLGVINMQQQRIAEAMDYYLRVAKIDPNHFDAHHNLGFISLITKNKENALLHFREALRIKPNNEAIRHTINILTQEKNLSNSPQEYIRSLFDSYADHYEPHLVQSLHYQVPQLMVQVFRDAKIKKPLDILDLGCGTGLSGEVFKEYANSLIGIDLAEKMLAIAAEKNIYDELVQTDIGTFLENKKDKYDLLLAADVLVYFGDLESVFSAAFQALRFPGWFLFNLEISDKEDYYLTPSGRFAHSKKYIDALALKNGFTVVHHRVASMRMQEEQPVKGYLYLLEKG